MFARIPYVPLSEADSMMSSDIGLGRPLLFQVTRVGGTEPLWPYALAMHTNPSQLQEQFNKSKNVVMTRGGFVEFVWPEDLDTLSADGSTGAFIGPDSGLTSDSANYSYQIGRGAAVRPFRGRHGTIAWERTEDLIELFRSNGQVFDGRGVPVLRSQIICMYDRGVYCGYFTTFEVSETGDLPYQFKTTWEFKATRTIYKLPTQAPAVDESSKIVNPWAQTGEQSAGSPAAPTSVDAGAQNTTTPAAPPAPETDQRQLNAFRASTRDRNVPP